MRISDWSSDVCSSDLTILVLAQHGLVGPMDTPLDISYLSDAVVMLRYFEVGGSVRRALSVVKKRSGNHEHTIREFQLTPEGIAVGPRLTQFSGVFSGTPVSVGAHGPPAVPGASGQEEIWDTQRIWSWQRSDEIGSASCTARVCSDGESME